MLRITLATIFLTMGNVESLHTYEQVTSFHRIARAFSADQVNPYIQTEDRPDDSGEPPEIIITFLQDITPDLGLQLAMEWRGISSTEDTAEMEILQDVEYQDFCSALENKTLQSNPYYPDPIALLGLSGQHCPIKKNTEVIFPCDGMPATIQAEFEVDCASWIIFIMYIEAENSTEENQIKYFETGWTGFIGC